MRVAVPELIHVGYKLIGVDRCGVGRRKGVHALYRTGSPGSELSLFTIGRAAALVSDPIGPSKGVGAVPEIDDRLAVVGWVDGPQTYIACAEVSEGALYDLVAAFRSNLLRAKLASQAVLASLK